MAIERLDAAVCNVPLIGANDNAMLSDVVQLLGLIAEGGEVKIAVEEVES